MVTSCSVNWQSVDILPYLPLHFVAMRERKKIPDLFCSAHVGTQHSVTRRDQRHGEMHNILEERPATAKQVMLVTENSCLSISNVNAKQTFSSAETGLSKMYSSTL